MEETAPLNQLEGTIKQAVQQGKKVHYLPPYRVETTLKLARLLGFSPEVIKDNVSEELIKAVVVQRSVKIMIVGNVQT